jgi:hypothetical protein
VDHGIVGSTDQQINRPIDPPAPPEYEFQFEKGDHLMEHQEPKTETMAETENYIAWKADEPDGETTYHLELNGVTLHFFQEEWVEFLALMRDVARK